MSVSGTHGPSFQGSPVGSDLVVGAGAESKRNASRGAVLRVSKERSSLGLAQPTFGSYAG